MKSKKILIIEDPAVKSSKVMSSAVNSLCEELDSHGFMISRAASYAEAMPLIMTDMDIDTILMAMDVHLDEEQDQTEKTLLANIV